MADRNSEYFVAPELHRLKGELRRVQDASGPADAELELLTALEVAREQGSKALELRAATRLARLRNSQGRRQEAYELVAPVYDWLTEGFDISDLKDAKALLEELRG